MKQCPKCSVTYANDKQKFCTKDGTALVDARPSASNDETVRIDSAQLDDEVTKFISRELPPQASGPFDPYKTTVSTPQPPSPAQPSKPIAPPPIVSEPAPPPSPAPPPPKPEPPASGGFDPFKTTIATPADEAAVPPSVSQSPSEPIASPPPAAPVVAAPEPVTPSRSGPSSPTPSTPAPPAPVASPPLPSPATASIGQAAATNASIPVDTVPPVKAPPTAQSAPAAAAQMPPAKKRSKLPLILGILFVLFVLVVGLGIAGYFLFPVIKPMLTKRSATVEPKGAQPTPEVVKTPDVTDKKPETPKVTVPPYSPPADAVQFVNSKAKLTGKLADHYVDFSFYYPNRWRKDADAGTGNSTNFAKVQRELAADAPQEIFAVGWYDSTGSPDTDQASFPRLVAERSAQFAKTYPEYEKISEGPAKAGPYDAYEFRFSGVYRNTQRGDVHIWGRVMFVPPIEGNHGVTLLMLASSLTPEVKSVEDVGVKGELPMTLKSFRFGN